MRVPIWINTTVAARRRIPFQLVQSADGKSPADITVTGVKASLSKNGGAPVNSTNDIVKVNGSRGSYYLELTAAEHDTLGIVDGTVQATGTCVTPIGAMVTPEDLYAAGASTGDIATASAAAILFNPANKIAADSQGRTTLAPSQPGVTIPTVTTLTNAPADSTGTTALLNRIGAFTGSGTNTVLGFLRALMRKDVTAPTDVGGGFSPATDSAEAREEQAAAMKTKVDALPANPAAEGSPMTLAAGALTAAAGYVAPDNAGIAGIKASTDNLPPDPARESTVGSRLAAEDYTAPDNGTLAAMNARLPATPAAEGSAMTLQSGERDAVAQRLLTLDWSTVPAPVALYCLLNAMRNVVPNFNVNPATGEMEFLREDGVTPAWRAAPQRNEAGELVGVRSSLAS